MKCYKDLNNECNPRKCDKNCYIKDKRKGIIDIFNSNNPYDRQVRVNEIALEIFQELQDEILNIVIDTVYEETKLYPNIIAIKIMRNIIRGIKEI